MICARYGESYYIPPVPTAEGLIRLKALDLSASNVALSSLFISYQLQVYKLGWSVIDTGPGWCQDCIILAG
jgi:hypothetical protein